MPTEKHVVLVGLPGSGKTSVGGLLAAQLGRAFLDFDEEIERREARTVARIFAESGERYFRRLELSLSEELAEARGMILSPGGGWITQEQAVAVLRPAAVIILLRVSPETALKRVQGGPLRPLLATSDSLAEIRQLASKRMGAYEGADASVDTELLDLQGVVSQVARVVGPS